jgi:predicted ATPase/DNA-binding SARP family transcriptional activator
VEIGVLGPVLVVDDDGAPVVLRSARQRVLLGVLIAKRGRTLLPAELAESLWAAALPAEPAAALQSHISRLRKQLGPAAVWIETTSTGYRFACPPDALDSARFELLLTRVRERNEEPVVALEWLDQALALWRGRPYLELADDPAIIPEVTRLEELRADATELRAESLMKLGRPAEAASAMQLVATDHPFRERPVGLMMRALAQDGRHAEALQEYQRFRRLLGDELGLEPSLELRAVEAAILRHEEAARSVVPAIGLPGNSFVGRDAEVAKITWLLEHGRLITLTGPGGVGKTRLALHVVAGLATAYADGVYLCELARVADAREVPAAVASTLHVEKQADRPLNERVIEFLQVKRALLVIDNCEHVISAAAELITAILLGTQQVDVLATSRERLGVEGEQRVSVGPLSTPAWDDPAGSSAVLFRDRARAVRPDLRVAPQDFATISELCRRLDGLPLAIELAAARSVSSSPSEILAAITDQLNTLSDRRRTVERHRSLDAVFGWSYGLLGPAERAVFERLALFAGGWTVAAAAAVADASPDDLTTLVEHSLVTARQFGRETRFSMLEPIRQYAEARLAEGGETEAARSRHAAWAVRFAEAAEVGLRGPEEGGWRNALATELANLRAAHRWCLEHDADASIRLAGSLYRYIWSGAPSEVASWAAQAVSRFPEGPHPRLPAAYAAAALGWCLHGDLAAARALAEAGIAKTIGDPTAARLAWEALGDIEAFSGNFEGAVPCFDQAIALAHIAGDHLQEAISSFDRALCPAYSGRFEEAIAACDDLAPLVAAVRNPSLDAWADYINGEVRLEYSTVEALPFLQRSVAAARRIGNRMIVGLARLSAVSCEARVGDPAKAIAQYGELIDHWHRDGAWNMQWTTVRTLIELLTRLGRDAHAAVLYGALTASDTASPLAGADATRIADAVAALRTRLGDDRFEALRADGGALSDNDAVTFALECVGWEAGPAGSVTSVLTAS